MSCADRPFPINGDTPRDCPPAADFFPCITAARSAFWTIPANALFPFVPRVGQYASGASEPGMNWHTHKTIRVNEGKRQVRHVGDKLEPDL